MQGRLLSGVLCWACNTYTYGQTPTSLACSSDLDTKFPDKRVASTMQHLAGETCSWYGTSTH